MQVFAAALGAYRERIQPFVSHMPLLHSQHIIWTDSHVLGWRLEDLEREVSEWVVS